MDYGRSGEQITVDRGNRYSQLDGVLVMHVNRSPDEFVAGLQQFLFALSTRLRATLSVVKDVEGGQNLTTDKADDRQTWFRQNLRLRQRDWSKGRALRWRSGECDVDRG